MPRSLVIAAAQLGPVQRAHTREQVVQRMLVLLRDAAAMGAELVVFPELCLTTFFPRWLIEDEAELDAYYETRMPGPATQALFDEAKRLGVGLHLGYAELQHEGDRKRRFNAAMLVERDGRVASIYRKVHLPGHAEPEPWRRFQHLEQDVLERARGKA